MEIINNLITEGLYNPVFKLEYIQNKYQNYSPQSLQLIINMFIRIGEEETQKGKDVVFFNHEELVSLFELNKWFSVSVIENKKTIIRSYMRWYRDNKLENWEDCKINLSVGRITPQDLSGETVYKSEWFKSLSELQSDIDILYDAYGGVDDRELDLGIVCIYLAWYGVDSIEAIEIRKCDVSVTTDQIFLPISKQFIIIDSKPMEFIRDYSYSNGYNVIYRGNSIVFREYKDTQYLLRTTKQERISKNNIRRILSEFSELYEESGKTKKFKYDRILKSGIYSKMIEYEKQNGALTSKDVDVFEKFFRDSYTQNVKEMAKFYSRLKDYQQFREHFNE